MSLTALASPIVENKCVTGSVRPASFQWFMNFGTCLALVTDLCESYMIHVLVFYSCLVRAVYILLCIGW